MLAAHISVPVAEDITVINKTSQNLHAEMLLRLLGKIYGTDGSFEEGTRVVRQFLVDAGIDDSDFFLYDGSGMSPKDKISPRAFTRLLAYASHQSWGAAWRDTLPVAGVDGTLDDRFKNSPFKGSMWAKTGTLDEVNALSGYVTTASGRDAGVFDPGERPPPRQQRRATGHRPHCRVYCRGGVTDRAAACRRYSRSSPEFPFSMDCPAFFPPAVAQPGTLSNCTY